MRETFDLKNISPGGKFPDESCPALRYILVLQRLCIQSLSLICFRFKTISKILVKSSLDCIYLSLSNRPALTALSEVTKLACREYLNKFVIYDIWINSKYFCHCFEIFNDKVSKQLAERILDCVSLGLRQDQGFLARKHRGMLSQDMQGEVRFCV